MQVLNVWDINAPVKITWNGTTYYIPHDGMPHWIPDEVSNNFKGLLRIIAKDNPQPNQHPVITPTIKDLWQSQPVQGYPIPNKIFPSPISNEVPQGIIPTPIPTLLKETNDITDEQIEEKLKELNSLTSTPEPVQIVEMEKPKESPKLLKGIRIPKKKKEKFNKQYVDRVNKKKKYLDVANDKIDSRLDLIDGIENNK